MDWKIFQIPFWKTYMAKAMSADGALASYSFFRGFPWQVVSLAQKWAAEKEAEGKGKFAIVDIKRI